MPDLEKDYENEILSLETQEPEQYTSFELNEIEHETQEPEQYSAELNEIEHETQEPEQYTSFEIEEERSTESELDDPEVTRFMPAMYEVFLKQGETKFEDVADELARDMTQYWFSWKGLKNKLKKAAGSKLGRFLINQAKKTGAGQAIGLAMKAIQDPSQILTKKFLTNAALVAGSSYLPPGVTGVASSLGIIPGGGPEKNKPAMGNLIKVVRDASEQVMNEVAESNDPLNPLEVNKIVTRAFEGQLQKNAVSDIRRKPKSSFVLPVGPNVSKIRISFY
jgi:hypothetical protein